MVECFTEKAKMQHVCGRRRKDTKATVEINAMGMIEDEAEKEYVKKTFSCLFDKHSEQWGKSERLYYGFEY
jgi:hypothetical protein